MKKIIRGALTTAILLINSQMTASDPLQTLINQQAAYVEKQVSTAPAAVQVQYQNLQMALTNDQNTWTEKYNAWVSECQSMYPRTSPACDALAQSVSGLAVQIQNNQSKLLQFERDNNLVDQKLQDRIDLMRGMKIKL